MQSFHKKYKRFFINKLQSFFQLRLCHSLVPSLLRATKNSSTLFTQPIATFLFIALLAITFSACQKVIDVGLNTAEKRYVIEAVITDQPNSCKVLLTQTRNFDENNVFNGVTGASITISDNSAVPVTLTETSSGVYEAASLKGIPGHTYNLTTVVAGHTFTATSKMPALVPFDSLYISERTFFDKTNKYATLSYKDPAGRGNAYRYIQYVNGIKEKTVFVRDDDLTDGRAIERILFFFTDDEEEEEKKKLKTGDIVTVEMLSIDYPIYKYWYSLSQSSTGENQSATPGNPVNNIQGGALGYFSAHTSQSKTIVVP
jgi:hypothetical protein